MVKNGAFSGRIKIFVASKIIFFGGLSLFGGQYFLFQRAIIGPSGVRALPLAAGMNEGGHYFFPLLILLSYHRYSKPQKGLS